MGRVMESVVLDEAPIVPGEADAGLLDDVLGLQMPRKRILFTLAVGIEPQQLPRRKPKYVPDGVDDGAA